MMAGALRRRNGKDRAKARPLRKIETIAIDEIAESLIDTFPASDPPAWIPLARVGTPKRPGRSRPARKI
jgi:hypothetical protein